MAAIPGSASIFPGPSVPSGHLPSTQLIPVSFIAARPRGRSSAARTAATIGSGSPPIPGPDVVRMDFPTRTIAMAVDPAHPQHLYVALEVGGVIRSLDGGETWQPINRGLSGNVGLLDLHGIQVSSAQPDTVFITVRAGLLRSDDRGEHWQPIDLSKFSHITYCRDLRVAPDNPRTLYISLGQAARSAEGALLRSRDFGSTWERIDRGLTPQSTMMAVGLTARQPSCVYGCTRDGEVFGTHDDGASWRAYPLPTGTQEVRAIACG